MNSLKYRMCHFDGVSKTEDFDFDNILLDEKSYKSYKINHTYRITYYLYVQINNINMLYYDIIDISEGIYVNKTNASKESDICHYWYFLDKGFKFQPDVCNGCNDVLMMSVNVNDIAVLNN